MNLKQYNICRLSVIVVLSLSISVAITQNSYYLPIAFVLTAMAVLYYCKRQLKTDDVLADERDYKTAGDAARYAIFAYSWIGAIGTFVLMAISNKEGVLYVLSQYLAYSVCFLMLTNAALFKFLSKRGK